MRVGTADATPITLGELLAPGVRTLICTEHGSLQGLTDINEIDRFIADPKNLLWLDIDTSVTDDLSILTHESGFHELAIEDALRHGQRPKIDTYEKFSFLAMYSVGGRTLEEGLDLCQLSLFIGPNYIVTVHKGEIRELNESAARWRANLIKIDRDLSTLLYSLLDAIVDSYFPVIDSVADIVEDVEEAIFENFNDQALERIFHLKKQLLALRRVVAPERDVLNVMIRREVSLFGESSLIYFQDVYDHLVRVTDSIDIYRDLLSSALDAYLSMASNRLNEVMRSLTSWTIPLMTASLLAGIWGMNFTYMPELGWRYGYPLALTIIATVITCVVIYFRRRRWI